MKNLRAILNEAEDIIGKIFSCAFLAMMTLMILTGCVLLVASAMRELGIIPK